MHANMFGFMWMGYGFCFICAMLLFGMEVVAVFMGPRYCGVNELLMQLIIRMQITFPSRPVI